jgi:soluble cytochrome b562
MSGTHKYPTISFRISSREREEIEAKIFASGMKKKDYFVRSCIYNHVCVVGKKEMVYQLVEKLQEMQKRMEELAGQIKNEKPDVTTEEIRELQTSYEDMLKAILWMLDGAKYLWQGNTKGVEEKSPDSGNC